MDVGHEEAEEAEGCQSVCSAGRTERSSGRHTAVPCHHTTGEAESILLYTLDPKNQLEIELIWRCFSNRFFKTFFLFWHD